MPQKSADLSALPNRTSVSLITGYLGSGKTTLINHLVAQDGMDRTVLIINEFGEIGIDHLLVDSAIENTLLLENGCICCTIRGDLVDTICDLYAKVQNDQLPAFDRILVETTGLADPGPIVRSIVTDDAVKNRCRLETIVTLVDGVLGRSYLAKDEEPAAQIAYADIVLITKTDLCDDNSLDAFRDEIHSLNPDAEVIAIQHGRIDPNILFRPIDHQMAVSIDSDEAEDHAHDHRHGHVQSLSIIYDAPIDGERLRAWLRSLYSLRAASMLRFKGIFDLSGESGPLLLQAVAGVFSPPVRLKSWPDGGPETRFVLIFKELSAPDVERSFRANVLE